MAGTIVLLVLALVAFGMGTGYWSEAPSAAEQAVAVLFWVLAAVCLSGAVIAEALRHHVTGLAKELRQAQMGAREPIITAPPPERASTPERLGPLGTTASKMPAATTTEVQRGGV